MSDSEIAGVHLVGSIGLDTVDDVFRTVGELLGPHLRRVPDGEVGGRRLWISWQYPLLRSNAFLRPDPSGAVPMTIQPAAGPGDYEVRISVEQGHRSIERSLKYTIATK